MLERSREALEVQGSYGCPTGFSGLRVVGPEARFRSELQAAYDAALKSALPQIDNLIEKNMSAISFASSRGCVVSCASAEGCTSGSSRSVGDNSYVSVLRWWLVGLGVCCS